MFVKKSFRVLVAVLTVIMTVNLMGVCTVSANSGIEIILTDVTESNPTTMTGEAKIKVSVKGAGGSVSAVQTALKFSGDLKYKSIDFLQGTNNPPSCVHIPPNAALANSTGKLLPSIATNNQGKLTFGDDVTPLFVLTFVGEPGDSVELALDTESEAGSYLAVNGSYIDAEDNVSPVTASASNTDNKGTKATVKVVMDKVSNFRVISGEKYADSRITLAIINEETGSTISTVLNTIADIDGGHVDSSVSDTTFVVENTVLAGDTYTVKLTGEGYVSVVMTGVDFSKVLVIKNDEFIPGDVNSDGVVDINDKTAFEEAKNGEYNQFADINRSNSVDEGDNVYNHITEDTSTVPSKVKGLTLSVSDTTINASWSAPSDGGSPITEYKVLYGTSESSLTSTLRAKKNDAQITGLSRDTTYYVKVAAVNSKGEGEYSDVKSITTPKKKEDSGSGGGGGGFGGGGGTSVPPVVTPPVTTPNGFTDLANYEWASDAIYSLRDEGIINGISATQFAPQNNIRRADFILILVRMMKLTGDTSTNFADVPFGSYYYDAVAVAKAHGIATGDGVNFMPENTITRQDLITLSYRAFVNSGKITPSGDLSALDTFSDKDTVSEYAREAMASMVNAGIIKGADGKLNPLGNATRAEVAVMCQRLNELIK